jgi:uncharacterized protein
VAGLVPFYLRLIMRKLQVGHRGEITVRYIHYEHPQPWGVSLLFISDLHLNGYNKERVAQLVSLVNTHCTDLILLGGDYVDTYAGLPFFDQFLAALPQNTPKVAIWGNHDHYWNMARKLRPLLEKYAVVLLENATYTFSINDKCIQIDGNQQQPLTTPVDGRVLLTHYPQHAKFPYHLALAGHLHGAQWVFWETAKGMYPGRWFYRWNVLQEKIGHCLHIVSRGVGDTLPIRYNCPQEIIYVRC